MSAKGTLRSVLWYGNERPDLGALLDTMDEDSRTDVVITTYGTLQSEHAKWLNRQGVRSQLKSLFDGKFVRVLKACAETFTVPWLRVVLGEFSHLFWVHTLTTLQTRHTPSKIGWPALPRPAMSSMRSDVGR